MKLKGIIKIVHSRNGEVLSEESFISNTTSWTYKSKSTSPTWTHKNKSTSPSWTFKAKS